MIGMTESGRTKSAKHSSGEPKNWRDVNERLAWLSETERQIRSLRDAFEQKVMALKQQLIEAIQLIEREQKKLEEQIERFYWEHRDEVLASGRKSVELSFGRLGSRRSRSHLVEDAAAAQQWLSGKGLTQYLRVRTDLDRESIRSVLLGGSGEKSFAELASCPGIRVRESEEFWYEVDRTVWGDPPVQRRAAKESGKELGGEDSSCRP